MGEITVIPNANVETYRASTDAAAMCREIVVASAQNIQGRNYVKVEGWQAIAIAHGCTASARGVERVEGGVKAIGEIRRMADGAVIAEAEGFVGEDEPTWYGGEAEVWDKQLRKKVMKLLPKRPDYAIRAMAQTRAISRAGRSAFAHVVVMMNAGLSTTPAEEVPSGGFNDDAPAGQLDMERAPVREKPAPLQGPIKTREKLKEAMVAFVKEARAAGDRDTLDALCRDNKGLIDQIREEHKYFWDGDGAEFRGLNLTLEDLYLALDKPPEHTEEYEGLLREMRQCVDRRHLVGWQKENLGLIDLLDSAERDDLLVEYGKIDDGFRLVETAKA